MGSTTYTISLDETLDTSSYKTKSSDYQTHNRELEEDQESWSQCLRQPLPNFFFFRQRSSYIMMTPEYEIILVQTAEQRQECYDVVNSIIYLLAFLFQ